MPPAEPSTTHRILFVGNSYTGRNQLPRLIADIAAASDPPRKVEVAAILAGGASLKRHWNSGKVQQALQARRWDDVVLQEQSTLPMKNAQRYHENVRLFVPPIRGHGARLVLYLTWARREAPERQRDITAAVQTIADATGALVVPVGPAWETSQREHPEIALYEDDGSHPTAAGSFLAACIFHARLFGERPNGVAVAGALELDREAAEALQALAWRFRLPPPPDLARR